MQHGPAEAHLWQVFLLLVMLRFSSTACLLASAAASSPLLPDSLGKGHEPESLADTWQGLHITKATIAELSKGSNTHGDVNAAHKAARAKAKAEEAARTRQAQAEAQANQAHTTLQPSTSSSAAVVDFHTRPDLLDHAVSVVIVDDAKLIYVDNVKAGSTTLRDALQAKPLRASWSCKKWPPQWKAHASPSCCTWPRSERVTTRCLTDAHKDYFVFSVVRHPVDKFESGVREAWRQTAGRQRVYTLREEPRTGKARHPDGSCRG